MNTRRLFVAVHLVLAVIPFVTGALELAVGSTLLAPDLDRSLATTRVLDSNLRFFGGFWLMAGGSLLWALRDLPARATQVRWLWAMIFLGGVGRLISVAAMGTPPLPFVGFTLLELVGAPLFVLWLRRASAPAL